MKHAVAKQHVADGIGRDHPAGLRLLRALAAEQHEEWLAGARYLDMQPLADRSKTQLQLAA